MQKRKVQTHGQLGRATESHGDCGEDGRFARTVVADEKVDLRSELDCDKLVTLFCG